MVSADFGVCHLKFLLKYQVLEKLIINCRVFWNPKRLRMEPGQPLQTSMYSGAVWANLRVRP